MNRHQSPSVHKSGTVNPVVFVSHFDEELSRYWESGVPKDRKPAGELMEQVLEAQWEIRQSQSDILRLFAEHDKKAVQKCDLHVLETGSATVIEELKSLKAYVESMSLKRHYTRVSLAVVALTSILTGLSLFAGGSLTFGTDFFFFALLASLFAFWLSFWIPDNKR